MPIRKTVRGGLILAALASGCGEHHLRDDSGIALDADRDVMARLDAGRFDVGGLVDAGMRRDIGHDSGTGRSDSLAEAIRAVCTKLVECLPELGNREECIAEYSEFLVDVSGACAEAYALYLDCAVAPPCSVIRDEVAFAEYRDDNCAEVAERLETCE